MTPQPMQMAFCRACAEIILATWTGRPLRDALPFLPLAGPGHCVHDGAGGVLHNVQIRWEYFGEEGLPVPGAWRLAIVEEGAHGPGAAFDGLPYHSVAPCGTCRRRALLSEFVTHDQQVGESRDHATSCRSCRPHRLSATRCRACRSHVRVEQQVINGRIEGVLVCLDETRVGCGARTAPREATDQSALAQVEAPLIGNLPPTTWEQSEPEAVIENCESMFREQCPQVWSRLTPTANPGVRHCGECRRDVYHVRTVEEARGHAEQGHCIAMRAPGDSRRWGGMMVGRPWGVLGDLE